MTRYRCNHCRGVFVGGEVRDCCLKASVAEQKRLRHLIESLRDQPQTVGGLSDVLRALNLTR